VGSELQIIYTATLSEKTLKKDFEGAWPELRKKMRFVVFVLLRVSCRTRKRKQRIVAR